MAIETLDSTKDQTFKELSQSRCFWLDSVHYRNAKAAPYYLFEGPLHSWVDFQERRFCDADTHLHSLVRRFVDRVHHLPEIERVFWKVEDDRIRVWTIIDRPDLPVENEIYDAQLDFMDMFPELSCDFAVIFRQGKVPDQISPEGAKEVFTRV